MAMVNKTMNMLEGFVKDGSFKWLTRTRSAYDEEIEEMGRSPSAGKNWLPELSPVANVVVRRCSKILGVTMEQLRENFEEEASDTLKIPPQSVRNFLEYCCFRALALSTQVTGYLEDRNFRRLTFDMMVAWEFPAASSQAPLSMDGDVSVALEAFSRIAPAVPIVADVIVCDKLFEELTASGGGRLQFSVYDKYLSALERAVRKVKTQSDSSLLSTLRSARGERILEVDGTVTSQPVLEHVGISTWPGRLVLTDHALYFEALRVVSYDKAKVYDLSDDLKQVVRPELTGPWGTRLFDKAFLYKSISVPEPVVMELPELKGHTRRDYWLAIIQEVLYAHKFILKFEITGIQREEALLKAIFGILRVQALKELSSTIPLSFNSLLMFNICDELPGGDRILETLAKMSTTRDLDRTNFSRSGGGMYSVSASAMASTLGFVFGSMSSPSSAGLLVGEIAVGEFSPLEKVVMECRSSYKKVVDARATVDGVKVDGLDMNLAVTMELLSPLVQVGNGLQSLAYWEYPRKSALFCLAFTFVIYRGWLGYAFALLLVFFAAFLVITRWFNQGKTVEELKVIAPPAKNAMEQLLAVQTVISQVEELVQDGNVCLLKLRGLLLAIFPQASEKLAVALLMMALVAAFVPGRYILLLVFLETFTRFSPLRRASTEKWTRRFREWWFSIPAAPVVVERCKEDKKKK